jgi:hypothetical protein
MAMRMAAQAIIPEPGRNHARIAPFSSISPQRRPLIQNGIPSKNAIPGKVIFSDRCHTRECVFEAQQKPPRLRRAVCHWH